MFGGAPAPGAPPLPTSLPWTSRRTGTAERGRCVCVDAGTKNCTHVGKASYRGEQQLNNTARHPQRRPTNPGHPPHDRVQLAPRRSPNEEKHEFVRHVTLLPSPRQLDCWVWRGTEQFLSKGRAASAAAARLHCAPVTIATPSWMLSNFQKSVIRLLPMTSQWRFDKH